MHGTEPMTATPRQLSIRRPRRMWIVVAMAAVGAGLLIFKISEHVSQTVPDLYAQEWVARIVITHMRLNEGRWPTSWDDLEEAYQVTSGQAGRPWAIDELRRRVDVDFSADPNELAKNALQDGKAPFRVMYLRNGKRHHWAGGEPNLMIWRYLQEWRNANGTNTQLSHPVAEEKRSRVALLELGARWELDDSGNVKVVQLTSPRFADDAMEYVQAFSQLRGLNLGDSGIGDTGMKHVRNLTHLEWIYLYRSKVTDFGLAHLEGIEGLKTLVLADPKFTDAAFDTIVRLRNLELLNLNGTRVTDAGIARLYGMRNLKKVMLGDAQVTSEGVRRLQAALPECDVYFPSK